jgi:hypothetical protein
MSCDSFGNNCSGNAAKWVDPDIWKLGYDPERWGMVPDPQTLATVIRDGNYDFLTNSQRWHNTPGGFTIPNSMYLTSTPAFFGSNPWPWVDPTTGTTYTLPAKARYDAGTPNQVPNQSSYSIAVTASPSSGGTVAGGGTFAAGSSDTVTATPNSGCTFVSWTENGTVVSTAASYTFTPTANRNLVANFNVPVVNYTIALSASPTAGGTVSGSGTFSSGTIQTVTATANSGYSFASWTQNGTVVSTGASYTFTLSSNTNLVANFQTLPPQPAAMSTPIPGSILTGSSATFTWTAGTGNSQYWLSVGTTAGGTNLYNSSTGTNLTATVNELPVNGQTLYVTLWWLHSGTWSSAAYTYVAANLAPAISSPAPGSTIAGASATFTWTAGSGNSQYWLSVGTTAGGTDLYNLSTGTNRSATVSGLPINGQTLYVRLWWLNGGAWGYADYTYLAANPQLAALTTPTPGSALPATSSSVTFGWTSGLGVTQYWLYVGSSPGGLDFYNASTGTTLSATALVPVDGRTIYVRLWSLTGGGWQFTDYTYKAGTGGLTAPTPQAVLSGSSVTFTWSANAVATQYWLSVSGASLGGNELYNQSTGTARSTSVSGLPTDGRTIYVRLWYLTGGTWLFSDYLYTASGSAQEPRMTAPAPGATIASASQTFGWSAGTGFSQYWVYVGSSVGGYDLYNKSTGTNLSAAVSNLPTDGRTLYVRLWFLSGTTWLFNDFTYYAPNSASNGS